YNIFKVRSPDRVAFSRFALRHLSNISSLLRFVNSFRKNFFRTYFGVPKLLTVLGLGNNG
ncbi:hypothetical protein, partial [Nostoc sp. T09]|uniref:hypothetical protein n=1 Tax=Nostoc sp. T09 TaxID=1932621 RepID=UPI001C4E6B04